MRLSNIDGARRSDDLVTVSVTVVSNGHLALESTDEFCVSVAWSTEATADAGVTDAGVSDAGLVPGAPIDSVSKCQTVGVGMTLELTSTRAIPRPAVMVVKLTKGFALGGGSDATDVRASP